MANDAVPIAIDNGFAALANLSEDQLIEFAPSPGKKRKNDKSPVNNNHLEVVLNIPKPPKPNSKPNVDDVGFTHVSNRKSSRLAGLPTTPKRL